MPGQIIILTSTSYVGTTRDLLTEPLRQRGLGPAPTSTWPSARSGSTRATRTHLQSETPRVVGGATEDCTMRAAQVIGQAHRLGVPGQLDRRRRGHQALREHLPRRVPGPGQRVRRRVRRAGPGPDRGHAGRGHQAVRVPGRVPRAGRGRSLHSVRPALPALAAERAGPRLAADRAGHEVDRGAPGTGGRAGRRGDRGRGPPAGRGARDRDRCQLQGGRPGPARVPGPAHHRGADPGARRGLLLRPADPGARPAGRRPAAQRGGPAGAGLRPGRGAHAAPRAGLRLGRTTARVVLDATYQFYSAAHRAVV